MKLRFLPIGRFQMNRMSTVEESSLRWRISHSFSTNSFDSAGCWNSHATAVMPSEMNMSRNAWGSLKSLRRSSAICRLNSSTLSDDSSDSISERELSRASVAST